MKSPEVFTQDQINGPKNAMGYPEVSWHPVYHSPGVVTLEADVLGHNTDSIPHKPKSRRPKGR